MSASVGNGIWRHVRATQLLVGLPDLEPSSESGNDGEEIETSRKVGGDCVIDSIAFAGFYDRADGANGECGKTQDTSSLYSSVGGFEFEIGRSDGVAPETVFCHGSTL